ncbi:MAG: hypothetical protein KAI53_04880 [Candidatus Aenigmarchaeota archaeon]|nr:hypothetical protein [Candidatus Aenigmarchaeota archaeon]
MMKNTDNTIEYKKEMTRLKFVLDQANRYPDLLDKLQVKRFSLRLSDLERKLR